jgi:branched-chain amino acid transport system substrate-binding protein
MKASPRSFFCHLCCWAVCMLLSLFEPLAWAQSSSANPIVIHHIGPFTGVLAAANSEAVKGAEIFFDALNKKGGVNGRLIKLEKLDDKQDAKESARLFTELIDQAKALTLFMPRTTPSILALMKVAEERKVPVFGMQTGGIQIAEPPKRYVFTLRASYQDEVIFLIRQLHRTGVTRIGFLAATDAFGKDVMQGVDLVMKELGIQAVSVQPVDQIKPEVGAAVDAMLAAQPQYVVLVASVKGATDFVKLYRQKGGTAQFATLSNNGADAFVKALGEHQRGVIVTQTVPTPFRQTSVLAREYTAASQVAQVPVSFSAYYGYMSAKTLAEALRRAGRDLTPEKMATVLDNLGAYDLGGYVVEFKPGQRLGSRYVEASIISRDGKFMN